MQFGPWSGRSPGEGHGYPLQSSCLKNPMDRAPWWATVHGVTRHRLLAGLGEPTVLQIHLQPLICCGGH